MTHESINATVTIDASAEAIFAVLVSPDNHAAIDGTGWVREPLETQQLTRQGQIFRMAMYHENHPDGSYEMANKVQVIDPPHAVSWEPGQDTDGGNIEFGGWIWRYDLEPVNKFQTQVTLSYDWSAVPEYFRHEIQFPPFPASHLENSLDHLAVMAES